MSDQPAPPATSFLAALQTLCSLLSQDPLSVAEVQRSLAELSLPASVTPEPGGSAPFFVRILLPAGVRLTLEELQTTFGAARQLPGMGRGAPLEYLIPVDLPGAPYTCALLLEKQPNQIVVETVTIRRDMRL